MLGIRARGLCWGLALGLLLVSLQRAASLSVTNYATQVSAVVTSSPPRITVCWPRNPDAVNYSIYRKALSDSSWGSPLAVLTNATKYVDTNVTLGLAYEYQVTVLTDFFPYPNDPQDWLTSYGYCYAGIDALLIESRGKIVLIVDNRFSSSLASELTRLQQDLVGDGWTVLRHDVSPSNTVSSVRALIQSDYDSDPAQVRSVLLFGHIPVPYSGAMNPDEHEDHFGAWPADVYYADMDGVWSDVSVNVTAAEEERNHNVPGDGKFDPSQLPSDVELEVGRVDLSDLPAFSPKTEEDLLRQYLNKDHNYRFGDLTLQRRGLMRDDFDDLAGEAPAACGWRNFSALFGSNTTVTVGPGAFFTTLQSQSYLFAYGAGGGSFQTAEDVGSTTNFATGDPRAAFYMLFGSYFGDWDARNDFLRAPLASTTYGVASMWAGFPHWFVQHMALGETIGYGARLSQNNATNGLYRTKLNSNARGVHVALMGDPTLRLHPARPASALTNLFPGAAFLSWTASPDAVLGYHVYRAANPTGPFTRLTATLVVGTSFADATAPQGTSTYMVRAVKLETSGSGTYFNPSQGIFLTVNVTSASACLPGPTGLADWWPGDNNAWDIQGTNDGTPQNGITYTNGRVGQAFWLDGVNDSMAVGAKFNSVTDNFTIMFWALPGAGRTSTVESASGTTGTSGQRYAIYPAFNQAIYGTGAAWGVSLGTNGASVFESATGHFSSLLVYNTTITNWTHVTIVCSNRWPKLYLDGVLRRVGLRSFSVCHPSADISGTAGYFLGAVDEIAIFRRVLSASEIQAVSGAAGGGMCKDISIVSINQPSPGQTLITLEGRTGYFGIESSSNLINWSQVGTLTNLTGLVQYLDYTGSDMSPHFYRAVLH